VLVALNRNEEAANELDAILAIKSDYQKARYLQQQLK
jgi:hypothetical protein